jgi:hypothetical protein
MRKACLSVALAFAVLAGGAGLAAAEETVTPQEDPRVAPEKKLLPEELQQVLTPAPEFKAPITYYKPGPCSVSVTCRYAPPASVSCYSETGCTYQLDYSPTYPGWVKCGSYTAYCNGLL